MPAIDITEKVPPAESVVVVANPMGNGAGAGSALTAGAQSYRFFMTSRPTYITGIQVITGVGTVAGSTTFIAGFSTNPVGTAALTTSNFGDATVTVAASTVHDLPIATATATETRPLLLPANTWVGFVTSAATANTTTILAVRITYRSLS